jgi:hypothetical protein
VIILAKEICEDGGIAIMFTVFGPGSEGNGITKYGDFERGGREGEGGEEKDEERTHVIMDYVDCPEDLNIGARKRAMRLVWAGKESDTYLPLLIEEGVFRWHQG